MRFRDLRTHTLVVGLLIIADASLGQESNSPSAREFDGQAKPIGSAEAKETMTQTASSTETDVQATSHTAKRVEDSTWSAMVRRAKSGRSRGPRASERIRIDRRMSADDDLDGARTVEVQERIDLRQAKTPPALGELPTVPRHRIGSRTVVEKSEKASLRSAKVPQSSALPATTTTSRAVDTVDLKSSEPVSVHHPIEVSPVDQFNGSTTTDTAFEPMTQPSQSGITRREHAVLLSSSGPAISVDLTGLPKTIIGKAAPYTVTATNSGDVKAEDVSVLVSVPNWMEINGARTTAGSARTETDGNQNSIVNWKIRQLGARTVERLVLNLIPREGRTADLNLRWTFSPAEALAQIEVQEPKLQMHLSGPPDVLFGETRTYTITLTNPGTGDAENVVLNLLPVSPNNEAAAPRDIGRLQAGERKAIDVELAASQAGRLQVRAHATADGGLRAEAAQDVLVRRANLQVAVAGPPMKFSGTSASYKIRVANTGDATASDVVLHAVLPAGAKYVSSTDGGKMDAQQGQVVWNVGTLRHGAQRIFDLQCVLSSPGDNRLDIRSSGSGELSATKSVVTTVEALADLKLHIDDPKGAIPTGKDTEYDIRIVNRGTKAAEHINVVAFFSDGIEPVSIEGWRGEVTTGQVSLDPIGRLNVGQELAFKIVARAGRGGTHRIRVQVDCDNPETELASEESTKFYGDSTVSQRPAVRQAELPSRN